MYLFRPNDYQLGTPDLRPGEAVYVNNTEDQPLAWVQLNAQSQLGCSHHDWLQEMPLQDDGKK